MSHLEFGSVVWVRLGQAWWPGTMYSLDKCPPEFVEGIRKPPVAVVKFFHENEFQDVHKEEHIFPYSCERKVEFIKRGQYINKNQSHGEVNLLEKFEADVVTAEKLTGGDMNILQKLGETIDFPSAPDIIQPDIEPDTHSTQIERPRGWLPGVGVIGEPEGPTQTESIQMRSPPSSNTQLVVVDEQDTSSDGDCYIEEEFDPRCGSMSREKTDLAFPNNRSNLTAGYEHIQPHSTQFDAHRLTVSTTDNAHIQKQGYSNEGVSTNVTQINLRDEDRISAFNPHQKILEYKDSYKATSTNEGLQGRDVARESEERYFVSESKKSPSYTKEVIDQCLDLTEEENEPVVDQCVDISEEESEPIVDQCIDISEEESEPEVDQCVDITEESEPVVNQCLDIAEVESEPITGQGLYETEVESEAVVDQGFDVTEVESEAMVDQGFDVTEVESEPVVDQGFDVTKPVVDQGHDVIEVESEPESPEIGSRYLVGDSQSHEANTQSSKASVETLDSTGESMSVPCYSEDVVEEMEYEFEKEIIPEEKGRAEECFTAEPVKHSLVVFGGESVGDGKIPDSEEDREALARRVALHEEVFAKKISKLGDRDLDDNDEYASTELIMEEDDFSPKNEEIKSSNDCHQSQGLKSDGSDSKSLDDDSVIVSDQEFKMKPAKPFFEASHIKENGTSHELSELVKEKNATTVLEESVDHSDSEQLVTSSGMDEVMDDDDQLEEDGCDSSINEEAKLDDSSSTVNLDKVPEAIADQSHMADEVEADTSMSELESNENKVDVSTSEDDASKGDRVRGRRTRGSTGTKETPSRSAPKRRQDSSQTKNKKMKTAKKVTPPEELDDSDELPDLLVSSQQNLAPERNIGDKKLREGDLAWVKYRKDWWPSYIRNVYPRGRRYSIVFIGCNQAFGIRVSSSNVKRLVIIDIPAFVNENQEGFAAALHLCKLFHQLIDGGKTISAHEFFSLSPQAQVAMLNQKVPSKGKQRSAQKKSKTPTRARVQYVSKSTTPKASIFDAPDLESKMSSREKSKLLSALKARKTDNEKLVKFMKSRQCKDYLWKIFRGEIENERHNTFKEVSSRTTLMWTGIGPFQLDNGDEQILTVINTLKEELHSKEPNFQGVKDYVVQVWIPEAIKQALRVVKKVPESDLDEALDKGYGETPVEKKARKLNF